MSVLDDIRAKLPDIEPDKTVVLKASEINIPEITNFFNEGLKVDTLTLSGASVDKAGDPMTISGVATVFEYPGLTVVLTFRMQDDVLFILLEATFPAGKDTLQLPLLDWIHLEGLGLSLTQSGTYNILNFAFHGNIVPDPQTKIPISVSPSSNQGWQLTIAEDSEFAIGDIAHLTTLLNGHAVSAFMPDNSFNVLNSIKLGHISAFFSLEQKSILYFTIQVGVSDGWSVVGDTIRIKENSLRLILTLINPTEPDSRQIIGIARGTVVIHNTDVPIFVQANVGSGSTTWMIGLDPASDGVTLPSFSDLFVLAGGESFKDTLPSFLRDIPQIRISNLEIDFSLSPRNIQLLTFAAGTTSPWPLIDEFLTVETLNFELDLLNLSDSEPTNRKIGGQVSTTFSITDSVWLYFAVQKDPNSPDWTFTGGLPPEKSVNLTDLIRKLLKNVVTIPSQVPTIIFETATVTVVPGKTISFTAGSTSTWALLPHLDLTEFTLQFTYDQLATKNKFNGSLTSQWTIGGAAIQIKALLDNAGDAGWQFDGSTTQPVNIHVSGFLATFDSTFPSQPDRVASGVPPMLDVNIKTLDVRFNTKTKDFHFDTEIDFGTNVRTVLTFSSLHQEGATTPTFEKRATGVITVFPDTKNEFAFDLGIDLKPDSKHFIALYNNTAGKAIPLGEFVKAMFPSADSLPNIPDFSITIQDAIVGYASTKQGDKTVSQSIFALDMGASLDLTSLGDIPLVGQSLSAAKTLKLAFQLVYPAIATDTTFAKADLVALNDLITVAGPKLPADQDLTALFVKTELRLGDGEPIDFSLPVKINTSSGQLEQDTSKGDTSTPPGSQATDDGVKWFQLNKKFGPVHLQRAGFKFDSGEVTALLDGGLTALGLEVDLMGLSVTTKVTGVKDFHPHFGLEGLGLSFSKGGVEIAGALLHLHVERNGKTVDEYHGLASVQAEVLRLAAIGSLTTVGNQASLFLYAVLDYPLGGAPFFYVTGLAGGFGLNQKLIMPAVDQVSTFPLVQAALNPPTMPTDAGSAGPFIAAEMQKLHEHLAPSIGQYFGCAGIRFTSFELLDSFVLVSLSFGHEFELDLLGMSTLVVPPKEPASVPALAVVSLQIAASFIPDEGLAIVQGRLTSDSHVLDPNCHLTGGFAFATWFGPNPHAGDFVITLGGYHPDFQKPDHYPTVPRIGVNWKISQYLSVTGGLYFALTSRALMAGGAMHALFQINLDLTIASVEVKAWFILGADFIVYWKPFHYLAHLYIDIGIDVVIHFLGTHDIGLDAGADLEVWGSPFGGHAHVSFKVIGITIGFNVDFGAAAPAPPPLDWDNADTSKSFRHSFLPADDQIVSVAIGEGLVRKVDLANEGLGNGGVTDALRADVSGHNGGKPGEVWYVINPKDFCVRTSSVIPIKDCTTTIQWADKKLGLSDFASNTDFGIASMDKDKDKVQTFHQITVTRDGQAAESHFVLRPIHSHVPGGLWAEENSSDINAKRLIENAVIGFEIVPAKPPGSGHTQPINRDLLKYTTHVMGDAYADHAISPFTSTVPAPGNDPAANRALWNRIQSEVHENTTRNAMLVAMGFAETDLDIGEPFTTDAAYAPSYGALIA